MTQEILFGRDFGEAIINVNGARLEIHGDGSVDTYTSGAVHVHPADSDSSKATSVNRAELEPGDKMPDGTIYAGISPDTNRPMYTTPADAPLTMKWKAAMQYAAKLDAHGHHDWRVPTKNELNVLFNNRAAIGGFNVTGSDPAGWYWSSTENNGYAWGQRFSDGFQYWDNGNHDSSLRCVRR